MYALSKFIIHLCPDLCLAEVSARGYKDFNVSEYRIEGWLLWAPVLADSKWLAIMFDASQTLWLGWVGCPHM